MINNIKTLDNRFCNSLVAAALGDINAAIFLNQLDYWLNKEIGIDIEGDRYIYNTLENWVTTQFQWMSIWTLRKAIALLKDLGLIKTIKYQSRRWRQTLYYTIDYKNLQKWMRSHNLLKEAEPIDTPDLCQHTNQVVVTHKSICDCSQINTNNTDQTIQIKKEKKKRETQLSFKKDFLNAAEQQLSTPPVPEKNLVLENRDFEVDVSEGAGDLKVKSQKSKVKSEEKNTFDLCHLTFDIEQPTNLKPFYKELLKVLPKLANPRNVAAYAHKICEQVKQGKPCTYWDDFQAGLPIGTSLKQEWEVEPGVVFPQFRDYLAEKLRAGDNTQSAEQNALKVEKVLSKPKETAVLWTKFKQTVYRISEQIERDRALGIANPVTPTWTKSVEEVPIEKAIASGEKILEVNDKAKAILGKYLEAVRGVGNC